MMPFPWGTKRSFTWPVYVPDREFLGSIHCIRRTWMVPLGVEFELEFGAPVAARCDDCRDCCRWGSPDASLCDWDRDLELPLFLEELFLCLWLTLLSLVPLRLETLLP